MAAVDTYTGRSGLIVALLAGAQLFTATLVWVRWRTSLDETGADQQGIGEGGRQELDQGADDLLDGGRGERLDPERARRPGPSRRPAPRTARRQGRGG